MTSTRAAIFAALFLLVPLCPAVAQDVTLTSQDGTIELSGTLLGFDGEYYRVDTIYGELTLDSSGVTCDGPGCPDLTAFVAEVAISGTAAAGQVLMPALIEAFALQAGLSATRQVRDDAHFTYVLQDAEDRPVARFGFRTTTTDEGFADLLAGEAGIVLAAREVRAEEVRRAQGAGLGRLDAPGRSEVLALDALVPVVSPGLFVREVSLSDLAGLLSGRLPDWSALGGEEAAVSVHAQGPQAGLQQALEDRVLTPSGADLSAGAIRHDSNAALADAVARDPLGIGVARASDIGTTQPLMLTGSCGMRMVPERATIITEDYPLTMPIYLYTPARRLPKMIREFLVFLRTDTAQRVIRRAGFVDQAPMEIPLGNQGDRLSNAIAAAGEEVVLADLQRMITVMRPRARLSTTFRFQEGASTLDAPSRSHVLQLARALEAGRFDGRELLFVGFSDGNGPAPINKRLGRDRAEAVRQAVLEAALTMDRTRVRLGVDSFGEALPMACDDTPWGRQVNRRVEVWVR